VFVLSLARAWAATQLVQIPPVPLSNGNGASQGVEGGVGLDVDESVDIRVWDSSAEIRYLVLPERPEGTEGMSEEELASLVTRDSMIGVGEPRTPEE